MNSDGALCVFDVKTKELREILDNTTFVSRNNQSEIKTLPLIIIKKSNVKGCFRFAFGRGLKGRLICRISGLGLLISCVNKLSCSQLTEGGKGKGQSTC